ncbi:MAG: molybdenum cofactor biosynthesis protein MoaE [Rhodobacteraceae bacterium]|nr:molybdenum cofactor biosynthesis protein MoaE [Paracoccaceae bacterium]
MPVRVQTEEFDVAAELRTLKNGTTGAGAAVTFSGFVRDDGGLAALELEHYPGMAEQALETICTAALGRWPLSSALIIHRVGRLMPGDTIMMVATLAPHRAVAFNAAEFLMDYLKSHAPFWKKEHFRNGESRWVNARVSDELALARWGDAPCPSRRTLRWPGRRPV